MIHTSRLTLRPWTETDADALFAINGDPEAMRYFPAVMDRAASDAHLARMMTHHATHGFGMWAATRDGAVIGIVGLQHAPDDLAFAPAIEIGWRFHRAVWRQGYANEAAAALIAYGRATLGLREIVALTATINTPSRALMEKLGMEYDPSADFDHPRVPQGSPLRPHVLYRK